MSVFKTLKRTDPEFKKYIWGSFSENHKAVPVSATNNGEVTFEIIPDDELNKPSFAVVLYSLTKWNYFYLLLVPVYYVFVKNMVYDRLFDIQNFIFSILSSIFLCSGLNIRNEVMDHLTGYDLAVQLGTPKPIAKGWISARNAQVLSWLFIFCSLILCAPVLMAQKEALRVAIVTLVLFVVGRFFYKNNYKFNALSEFVLFLLLGPALCSGYQVSLGSGVDTEILVFGTMWGVASMFLVFVVQFSNLFETSQAGIKNTITKIGFDKAKKYLKIWWTLFIVLWFIYHYFYSSVYWNVFTNLILIFWSFSTFIKISQVHSPIGSDLKNIRLAGFRIFYLMIFLIVAEQTWYLYNHWAWVN
jgi:1,4-dihydroxy-2-naphthoate polyprenyltransferase